MIQVDWPRQLGGREQSPFQRGSRERPLSITLHAATLDKLAAKEASALDALLELSHLPELDVLSTRAGALPWIRIEDAPDAHGYRNMQVVRDDTPISFHLGIHPSRLSAGAVLSSIGLPHSGHPDFERAMNHLIAAEAHFALDRDLFVTTSPLLLAAQERLSYANPVLPSDAARLVGLLLRSRDQWVYAVKGSATFTTSRSTFYWQVVRHRLPHMWGYNAACSQVAHQRGDDTDRISQAVLVRCARALQARDAVALHHYSPQSHSTRDQTMYAFDYLTLLLSGALDAQALIANRLCGAMPADSHPSFRWKHYVAALRAKGARRLCDYIENAPYRKVSDLLYTLRNTIHRASLAAFARVRADGEETSLVTIPEEMRPRLLEAVDDLGGSRRWGISTTRVQMLKPGTTTFTPMVEAHLEPWPFAAELTDRCLEAVDSIAAATDFSPVVTVEGTRSEEGSLAGVHEDDARFLILF